MVVARPSSGDEEATRRAFQAALFRTERPVLVVPPGRVAAFGKRVAIAWREDTRAAKAVLPALRCLGRAEQVHVLAGVRQGGAGPLRPAGEAEDVEPMGALLGVGIFSKGMRHATTDEREDARCTTWLFLALGLVMVVVGIAVDPRTSLF